MNLFPAFFHGEQALVALILGGFIIVVAVPLVFYLWLRRTKSSERKLTYTYVATTAVLCFLMALSNDEMSLFHLTVGTMAFILTLPWNVITLFAVSFAGNADIGDREIISAMLLGAGVNAMILYFLAKKAKNAWKV